MRQLTRPVINLTRYNLVVKSVIKKLITFTYQLPAVIADCYCVNNPTAVVINLMNQSTLNLDGIMDVKVDYSDGHSAEKEVSYVFNSGNARLSSIFSWAKCSLSSRLKQINQFT